MITYKFDVDRITDPGNVKTINEDCCIVLEHDHLASSVVLVAVADGVGGMDHGEIASSMVCEALQQWWDKIDWASRQGLDALMKSMSECIEQANEAIFRANTKKGIQSCTTLTVLLLAHEGYRIYHVGDSRIYHIDAGMFGKIQALTEDHTKLMPKEVDGQTVMKPYLTECVGLQTRFQHQETGSTFEPGEIFVVCSDGIYKTIPDKEIGKIVRRQKSDVDKACYDLIVKAKNNGETDNLTAAVVRIIN